LSGGDHRWFKRSARKKRPVTRDKNKNKNKNNYKNNNKQYIKRHDRVCAQLQFNVCKERGMKLDNEHWYEHVPKLAETSREGNCIMESTRANPQNHP
jgi:hypothetical protein